MKEKSSIASPVKWIGLKPYRFKKYQTWINRVKPGICGTYASAALVHDTFLQEYKVDLAKDNLLNGLKSVIDDLFPYKGTFPWDLKWGLDYVLRDIPELKVKMSLVPETTVVNVLNQQNPMPLAVGTAKLFGSNYKNHWLLVYAYGYNQDGKLFFKAYDNHGRYQAVVPASQTIGCVWIEKKTSLSRLK